jgi:hypothetical protein
VDLIAAGKDGTTLTYYPNLEEPGESYDVYLTAGSVSPDPDTAGWGWYMATMTLRAQSGTLERIMYLDRVLWKYEPGDNLADATFTRATTATYVDIDGVTQTDGAAVNEVRDGHYQTVDSVWTRTLRLESAESETLEVPWPHEPQAASVYVKFVERGGAGTSLGVLVAFGMETTDSGSPRWIIVGNGTSKYQIYHQNGTATSTATAVDTVSSGDVVEIVGQLKADGSVTILQSVDGAAVSSNSDATTATLQAAWNGEGLMIGTQPADLADGDCDIERIVVAAGVQTMDHMRSL